MKVPVLNKSGLEYLKLNDSCANIYTFHLKQWTRKINIPSRFVDASVADIASDPRPEIKRIMESIRLGEPFLIAGNPGVGKTHIMFAALNYYLSVTILTLVSGSNEFYSNIPKNFPFLNGRWVRFIRAAEVADFNADAIYNREDPYDLNMKCSFLFIDDLGVNRNTEFANQKLDVLIDYRYAEQLPTWITTNIGQSGADRLSERTLSRVRSMCKVYSLGEIE